MSTSSRVAWTEGLFLRPQHFQQNARFFDRIVRSLQSAVGGHCWGFARLDLNTDLLDLGKVAIDAGQGFFADGEVFDFPEHDLMPPAIDVPEDALSCAIFLSIQPKRFGDRETSLAGTDTRSKTDLIQVEDSATEVRTSAADVEVSQLATRLIIEKAPGKGVDGAITIPIARISDIGSNGEVKLEAGFIPTVMSYGQSDVLRSFANNIEGLLEGRSETLAARVTGASSGGAPEVSDYILLQTINRYLNVFRDLSQQPALHPYNLYRIATDLCAEFATYTQPDRVAPRLPGYDHRKLTETFRPVMDEVRRSLSYIGDPTAASMPLEDRGFGIQVSKITDRSILTSAQIVLAVGAAMSAEDLRKRFPSQVKIGSVDIIRDLVNVQIPGVRIKALPVAPRQIPYHAGKVYFELERKGDYWQQLTEASALAIHVGGQFPELTLALWAIRETRR